MKPSDEAMLKLCPFCGGDAEYHSDKGPTGEVYGWVGCNQCDAMSCHTDVRSMQDDELHPIDAWNTRAVIDRALSPAMDGHPTADAATVEAVARAMVEAVGKDPDKLTPAPRGTVGLVPLWALWEPQALAAIRQLGPVERVDDVAGIVAWLRANAVRRSDHMKADAIERGDFRQSGAG